LAGGPVLEVACGTGRITLPIAGAGIEIAGLDISRRCWSERVAKPKQSIWPWLGWSRIADISAPIKRFP
jgi:2-polyprenyl-3-methyl-5-hydroxy-6-metoxy-1,4-benzoquinol methylase